MIKKTVLQIYSELLNYYGPRRWWPAQTSFEMMVGAVLTQAVSWKNVVQAIGNLTEAGLLEPQAIYYADVAVLEELVRPSRYFKVKTQKLKALVTFIVEQYHGNLQELFQEDWQVLRLKMLNIYGMGPETVDSILLYGGNMPVFVVDAYTRRIFYRIGVTPERINYRDLQTWFTANLPQDIGLYNEFHALIDHHGNRTCRNQPLCQDCPLAELCNYNKNRESLVDDASPKSSQPKRGKTQENRN